MKKRRILKDWVAQILLLILCANVTILFGIDEIINIGYTMLFLFTSLLIDFIIYKVLVKYSRVFED